MNEDPLNIVSELEENLSIPKGFYKNLAKEDDWSFVIKLHSLIEAAVSHQLSKVIGTSLSYFIADDLTMSDLEQVFSWLELSNKRTGKIAFVSTLNLLHKNHRRFISSLSELRNVLVHDVKNVNFDFESYLASLDVNQLKNFVGAFSQGIKENLAIRGKELSREQFAREQPKLSIWYSGLFCLSEIAYCVKWLDLKKESYKEACRLQTEKQRLQEEIYKLSIRLLEGSQGTINTIAESAPEESKSGGDQ